MSDRGDASELRARWDARQAALKERFELPVERVTDLTQRTLSWFPIRVWRHFLRHNGFLLAAGISYQALFTIFASIYLAAVVIGVWLGGNAEAVEGLITLINAYVPNLVSDNGLIHPSQVDAAVSGAGGSAVTITGLVAVGVVVWTSIGFVTYTRRAVRDTFGLPYDGRSFIILKARDFVAALLFGVALLVGWALVQLTVWALGLIFDALDLGSGFSWSAIAVRVLTFIVAFAINAVALALLFRFLTATTLPWARIWPGSLLGGAALAVLQFGAGLLLIYSPSNPLLASFAILFGFLLWFRVWGIVILVAAAWIAVSTSDRNIPLELPSDEEIRRREQEALALAAQVRLREALEAYAAASWPRRLVLAQEVRRARLAAAAAQPPEAPSTTP
ncbi:YihY/virulence factor BrkB family protein [Microbacterium sp. GXF7504]